GKVKAITPYGAFIDLGGLDGLLHISDMSWAPIKAPNEVVHIGQELEVIVLKKDMESERVALGLKQKYPDPWTTVETKYPVNSVVTGKVVAITDYGAFVRLDETIEGMVHISEMSWTTRINHPSEVVKIGDEIKVKILNIDVANRRIALGIKQLLPSPWDEAIKKYPVGTIVKVEVTAITDYGAFVKITEGVEGLIHISDFSWTKPIKHPSEMVKVGEIIEARILRIDEKERKIGLGIKQITADPWLSFIRKYQIGSIVLGKIVSITNFGAFVELEYGVEGVCRLSQLDIKRIKAPEEVVKVGQEVQFKLVRLNKSQKQAILSRRAYLEEMERKDFELYIAQEPEIKTNLGELINQQKNNTIK
ncbi:MAG: S1 RNA-binding domain-containing protein, partial [bacterium]|nr:S1 RNA-binding domain-containing protein [bacterium]